jgi:hypothetical protein
MEKGTYWYLATHESWEMTPRPVRVFSPFAGKRYSVLALAREHSAVNPGSIIADLLLQPTRAQRCPEESMGNIGILIFSAIPGRDVAMTDTSSTLDSTHSRS